MLGDIGGLFSLVQSMIMTIIAPLAQHLFTASAIKTLFKAKTKSHSFFKHSTKKYYREKDLDKMSPSD